MPVGTWNSLYGSDVQVRSDRLETEQIGELYFNTAKLRVALKEAANVKKFAAKDLSNYERIRVVGKGAFGQAILYQKKDDSSLVVIKEVNMHDLSADERKLAINEIEVSVARRWRGTGRHHRHAVPTQARYCQTRQHRHTHGGPHALK